MQTNPMRHSACIDIIYSSTALSVARGGGNINGDEMTSNCISAAADGDNDDGLEYNTQQKHATKEREQTQSNDPPPAISQTPPSISSSSRTKSNKLQNLIAQANQQLSERNANEAFSTLIQAYQIDPTSTEIAKLFESCLRLKVALAEEGFYRWKSGVGRSSIDESIINKDKNNNKKTSDNDDNNNGNLEEEFSEKRFANLFQDRMGLSSLLIDKEQYDEAGMQLRNAIDEANFWIGSQLSSTSSNQSTFSSTESDARNINSMDLSETPFRHWQSQIDRARYLLYRTNAACCNWDSYFRDGDRVRHSMLRSGEPSLPSYRLLHPFDALKFPCISLELASEIAGRYAARALDAVGVKEGDEAQAGMATATRTSTGQEGWCDRPRPMVTATRLNSRTSTAITTENTTVEQVKTKIRIGYISPDFTSKHPLAFLMQHVFRHHDKSRFEIYVYSIASKVDNGQEVQAIEESGNHFTYLSPSTMSPVEMYQRILEDKLDILVDLCGYAGTSVVAEIMATRSLLQRETTHTHKDSDSNHNDDDHFPSARFPMHVSYMGFPGSVGSSRVWDYSVFDPIVVPPDYDRNTSISNQYHCIRRQYKEALIFMPHCYFVNSHKTVIGGRGDGIMLANEDERRKLRVEYGLDPEAFVYCCHSRPDKIDPTTFRCWMRVLSRVRSEYFSRVNDNNESGCPQMRAPPVLWLLRSGEEMERNLRIFVRKEFGQGLEDAMIFAGVAERNEHLRRLGCADVFLDTPSYNAHTLGCDALFMGVPMISLLRELKHVDTAGESQGGRFADADMNEIDKNENIISGKESPGNHRLIATDKLASRVGASLLAAVGMSDDLVFPDMDKYENAMMRCATDRKWFDDLRTKLNSLKDSSPLFDTRLWVENLEASFGELVSLKSASLEVLPDIMVTNGDNGGNGG